MMGIPALNWRVFTPIMQMTGLSRHGQSEKRRIRRMPLVNPLKMLQDALAGGYCVARSTWSTF